MEQQQIRDTVSGMNKMLAEKFAGKQDILESGVSIKTINSASLLGSGDIAVQPTLVSGTNIKTINGNSLLGSGNIAMISYEVIEEL